MSKLKSTTTDQSRSEDELIAYYALQSNNIRLQDAYRSSNKEMTAILTKCSAEIQEWKERWFQFYANNKSKTTDNGNLWDLFGTSVSSIDDFTDKIGDIIEKLKRASESIPKSKKHQTLKFQIKQAYADVDKLDTQLQELENEKKNLEKKIEGLNKSSSRNFLNCINPQTQKEEFFQRQTSIDVLINDTEKSKERKEKSFDAKKDKLYAKSKEDEINRCRQLQKQSCAFLKSFDINSDRFNALLETYNPENDFDQWEKEISHRNSKQSGKSQSTKNKTSV